MYAFITQCIFFSLLQKSPSPCEDFCNKIWKMADKYVYTVSHIWIIWQNMFENILWRLTWTINTLQDKMRLKKRKKKRKENKSIPFTFMVFKFWHLLSYMQNTAWKQKTTPFVLCLRLSTPSWFYRFNSSEALSFSQVSPHNWTNTN